MSQLMEWKANQTNQFPSSLDMEKKEKKLGVGSVGGHFSFPFGQSPLARAVFSEWLSIDSMIEHVCITIASCLLFRTKSIRPSSYLNRLLFSFRSFVCRARCSPQCARVISSSFQSSQIVFLPTN